MSYYFSPSLVLISLVWISLLGCDDTLSPNELNTIEPYVQNFSVNPATLDFDLTADGTKDTTITFLMDIESINLDTDSTPHYSVFLNSEDLPFLQGQLNRVSDENFSESFSINTKTYFFDTYTILITPTLTSNTANYSQSRISQVGVPFNEPEILTAENPSQVQRPQSGSVNVMFTAKATDVDRQANLDGVFLRLISRTNGEVNNSPFELFDNGNTAGDVTAQDSVFTLTFPVNSGNQLQTYDILYYAKDKSGLVSDTVKTVFSIVE